MLLFKTQHFLKADIGSRASSEKKKKTPNLTVEATVKERERETSQE